MVFESIDWLIIIAFLVLSLSIGIFYRKQASGSLSDFFLGGRNLPWYVAGLSMVATTFAADTPLWVTEVIAQHGISGNWLWWNMLAGGMLTTFFFARLWRKANILTELEFIELRYGNWPAKILRAFRSVYLGIFMNVIIIAWVNYALLTILKIFFNIESEGPWWQNELYWYILLAMIFVAIYSSLSGLIGVAMTDAIQFFIAMISCIILAVFVLDDPAIGGIAGLQEKLPAWRFEFFPKIGSAGEGVEVFSIGIASFLTFSLVQWWASWYPGAEPGGGGYIAQRMMSAKSEKDAVWASLFFQIAHYCLRPWPWIIVALCALVLYPDLSPEEPGQGFVLIMRDYLPAGLKGLLFVAFISAYMSTISTQLNWGASILTNDLYRRFIKSDDRFESEEKAQKHYVFVGRLFTAVLMLIAFLVTTRIQTIDAAAKFLIQCGAGLGLVLILRWYWWRINAWSEITASLAPIVGYILANYVFEWAFPNNFLFTVAFSMICWIPVTFLTKAESDNKLKSFFERVKPEGWWPKRISGEGSRVKLNRNLLLCWISGLIGTYSVLFGIGYLLFFSYAKAVTWMAIGLVSFISLYLLMRSTKGDPQPDQQ